MSGLTACQSTNLYFYFFQSISVLFFPQIHFFFVFGFFNMNFKPLVVFARIYMVPIDMQN